MQRGAGVQAAYTNLTTADVFFLESTGTEFIEFVGDTATARTVTIIPTARVDGIALANVTVNVPANQSVYWGLLDPSIYAANGRVQLTVSGACKLALVRF